VAGRSFVENAAKQIFELLGADIPVDGPAGG
jgi:hypothetical protein